MVDVVEALKKATSQVAQQYFALPVAGHSTPVKRERVYCYELYHQLRCTLPADTVTFSAEPDKRGNPTFQDQQPNPDFVFHRPGTHEHNQVVIEVECRPDRNHLRKDINTFRVLKEKGYQQFVLLLFAIAKVPWSLLDSVVQEVGFSLGEVTVRLHVAPGREATRESFLPRLSS